MVLNKCLQSHDHSKLLIIYQMYKMMRSSHGFSSNVCMRNCVHGDLFPQFWLTCMAIPIPLHFSIAQVVHVMTISLSTHSLEKNCFRCSKATHILDHSDTLLQDTSLCLSDHKQKQSIVQFVQLCSLQLYEQKQVHLNYFTTSQF